MNIAQSVVDVLVFTVATVVVIALIGVVVRRVLGVRIGAARVVGAGIFGLGAEIGFESQFVWGSATYSPALIPVQLGIILLVAVAFLVVAELVVPQGSMPRPDQWVPAVRGVASRARRYSQLTRIAMRHKLIPFKPDTGTTSAAAAARTQQARVLKAALEDAGGAFVKLGQILSTRTDILPVEFSHELGTLQQQVPPAPWEQVVEVLATELSRPLEEVFSQIEHEPVAAASLGQVHLATLITGKRVAVKVQRPGIIGLVQRDVDITRRIAARMTASMVWARQFGVSDLAESLSGSLLDELDYLIEASNMDAMEATQQSHPAHDRLRIPHQYGEFSTRRVLVMEFLEGSTLSDPAAVDGIDDSRRQALAAQLQRSVLTQIMDDGIFHSDLHPGNVMITPGPDLALLDFGSVGHLDSEVRSQITDLLIAFSRDDARALADALIAFVPLHDDLDEHALRRQIGDFTSRYLRPGATLDVAAFNQIIAILAANRLSVPPELSVAFRAIAAAEGTLRRLSSQFDFVAESAAYANQRLAAAKQPGVVSRTAVDELAGFLPLARKLPYRIDRISGSLADGRLSVNVRLFADQRDRKVVRELAHFAATAFLAGVFGIMAAMLLTSGQGPQVSATLTLYQVFGYLLVVASGILTLRVLFDVFRRRQRH
jgi:ubiquinone biosynthesis protein